MDSSGKLKEKELCKSSAPSDSKRSDALDKEPSLLTDAESTALTPSDTDKTPTVEPAAASKYVAIELALDIKAAPKAETPEDKKSTETLEISSDAALKNVDAKKVDNNKDKVAKDKAAKDKIVADTEEEDMLDEDAADSESDANGTKKLVKNSKNAKKIEEPAPVEPDSIFIDHGAILPEYIPGTCLYALVRDPGTLFVYWNATFESPNGWLLTAYDAAGHELQSFKTVARRNGRGYFRIPTARVARVTLSIVNEVGNSEVRLESKIRIAEQLGIVQPPPKFDERWVDVQNHEIIYEAPAPGRAPAFQEVYSSMADQAITGGGFDRTLETANASEPTFNNFHHTNNGTCSTTATGCSSSRFGSLNAPGSSDTLIGTSNCLVRK